MAIPQRPPLRKYRLESFYNDGNHIVVDLSAETDWRALDTLFYTAREAHAFDDAHATAFCLLKQRDDGTWGRIARVITGEGETVESEAPDPRPQCEWFGLGGEYAQCTKRATKTFTGRVSGPRPVCDEHYKILIDDAFGRRVTDFDTQPPFTGHPLQLRDGTWVKACSCGPAAAQACINPDGTPRERDPDPYEGSFREAADNEGARIATSHKDDDDS
jgi:hypothetical protein